MFEHLFTYFGHSNIQVAILRMVLIGILVSQTVGTGALQPDSSGNGKTGVGNNQPLITPPESIKYTCDSNGVKSISGVAKKNIRVITDDLRNFCTVSEALDITCQSQPKMTLYALFEQEENEALIGGEIIKYYKLKCTDKNPVNLTTSFTAKIDNTSAITDGGQMIPHDVTLAILDHTSQQAPSGAVNLGEEMMLEIKGKENDLVISPVVCLAFSSLSDKNPVQIWWLQHDKSGTEACNSDIAVAKKMWTKHDSNSIRLTFYAFRFQTSETVSITCTVNVCSAASSTNDQDCPQTCVSPTERIVSAGRRRRRSIETGRSVIRQATASFRVNMPIGNENNSSQGMFVHNYTHFLIMVSAAWLMKILLGY